MPVRKPSTERQRRLGAELRRMREHIGMTINEAATLHRTDRTTVSNTESARSGVSSDRVRVWATNYRCPDAQYVDGLVAMARERGPNWWDDYRGLLPAGLLDIAEMEHHAARLLSAQIMHVPGMLQLPDYMRGIFAEAVPTMDPADLERHIEFRVRRSALLDRPDPPACEFLVHESALRMRFGDRHVLRRQLEYLLAQAERPNVTLRVVPFDAGGFANAGSSTLYACGPVAALDTVQIDVPTGVTFLHAETHLVNYRAVLDRMRARAIEPEESIGFIRRLAKGI
ncbi:Scr1 family TA system antitoxin-like transcriptional regulator [Streptomyces sp. ITFR-6]|uniref:Scr1 family TA system antitoxin-like transcriptional regulator n=1 Tax=Streptomyces sp. ITFR-6 TaxID=3075197 RepID=UPI002889B6DE|nr:Scr1 family TA system antitoxin-like transcriptional regulator [Streptomyces sp. ITFR-6]WNI30865.1 Scr1 family TA system antitoxin-like transcriptional regulator [Streptomyces sp. ITFR-6]